MRHIISNQYCPCLLPDRPPKTRNQRNFLRSGKETIGRQHSPGTRLCRYEEKIRIFLFAVSLLARLKQKRPISQTRKNTRRCNASAIAGVFQLLFENVCNNGPPGQSQCHLDKKLHRSSDTGTVLLSLFNPDKENVPLPQNNLSK